MKNTIIFLVAVSILVGCSNNYPDGDRLYTFTESNGKQHTGIWRDPSLPGSLVSGKSGQLVVKYNNGTNWINAHFVDGQWQGKVEMWSIEGHLMITEHYEAGLRNGKVIWWYPNGEKQMEVEWVNGKKDGYWIEWNEDGEEKSRRLFKNDKHV